jgi:hypothetical protein
MRALVLLLTLLLMSGTVLAQDRKKHDRQQMKQGDRQGLRDDMRETNRGGRPERQRMTPQEREKLRQDIREANQNLKR